MRKRKPKPVPPRFDRFIARPGVPTHYSATEAAKLLGFGSRDAVWRLINYGHINAGRHPIVLPGVRSGRRWCIPRSEIIRLARTLFKDRTLKLRQVISDSQPRGSLFVVTQDAKLRQTLAKFQPKYVSSLFGLGGVLAVDAAWAVIVDFADVGRMAAQDMAERISTVADRPYLIGVLAEDSARVPPGEPWDLVIPRPYSPRMAQNSITKFRKPIFGG